MPAAAPRPTNTTAMHTQAHHFRWKRYFPETWISESVDELVELEEEIGGKILLRWGNPAPPYC